MTDDLYIWEVSGLRPVNSKKTASDEPDERKLSRRVATTLPDAVPIRTRIGMKDYARISRDYRFMHELASEVIERLYLRINGAEFGTFDSFNYVYDLAFRFGVPLGDYCSKPWIWDDGTVFNQQEYPNNWLVRMADMIITGEADEALHLPETTCREIWELTSRLYLANVPEMLEIGRIIRDSTKLRFRVRDLESAPEGNRKKVTELQQQIQEASEAVETKGRAMDAKMGGYLKGPGLFFNLLRKYRRVRLSNYVDQLAVKARTHPETANFLYGLIEDSIEQLGMIMMDRSMAEGILSDYGLPAEDLVANVLYRSNWVLENQGVNRVDYLQGIAQREHLTAEVAETAHKAAMLSEFEAALRALTEITKRLTYPAGLAPPIDPHDGKRQFLTNGNPFKP